MQGPASTVGVKVNAAVGVNGTGVAVGGICVGKTAVGGRNGVGAEGVEQATAKEKIGRRIKKRRRKKRGVISKLYAQAGVVIKEKDTGKPCPRVFLCFFFNRAGSIAAAISIAHVEREGNLATERFLADDAFDFTHEVGIAA